MACVITAISHQLVWRHDFLVVRFPFSWNWMSLFSFRIDYKIIRALFILELKIAWHPVYHEPMNNRQITSWLRWRQRRSHVAMFIVNGAERIQADALKTKCSRIALNDLYPLRNRKPFGAFIISLPCKGMAIVFRCGTVEKNNVATFALP